MGLAALKVISPLLRRSSLLLASPAPFWRPRCTWRSVSYHPCFIHLSNARVNSIFTLSSLTLVNSGSRLLCLFFHLPMTWRHAVSVFNLVLFVFGWHLFNVKKKKKVSLYSNLLSSLARRLHLRYVQVVSVPHTLFFVF